MEGEMAKIMYAHMNKWIKNVVFIYTAYYYLSIKKNEIMLFAGKWMELEIIMLSRESQAEKDNGHMFSLICWS
jgi:hypothetical protein